jgi:hypothetical protein
MAWSTSRAVAEAHVKATIGTAKHQRLKSGYRKLWRAVVPPSGVLGRVHQREEHEIIVDPSELRSVTIVTTL